MHFFCLLCAYFIIIFFFFCLFESIMNFRTVWTKGRLSVEDTAWLSTTLYSGYLLLWVKTAITHLSINQRSEFCLFFHFLKTPLKYNTISAELYMFFLDFNGNKIYKATAFQNVSKCIGFPLCQYDKNACISWKMSREKRLKFDKRFWKLIVDDTVYHY